MNRNELRHAIANLVHEVWSEWWDYQDSCSTRSVEDQGKPANGAASLTIASEKVRRWDRQAGTRYGDLTPAEQTSDIEIANRYLTLVEEHVAPYRQAYLEARAHVARQQHAGKHEQDRIDAVEWLEKWDLLGSEK